MADTKEKSPAEEFAPEYKDLSGESAVFDGTVQQAMQSYLRELGTIPKLTPESQAELAQQILSAENRWRSELYDLASCSDWQIGYMSAKDPTQWREIFMPSCLDPDTQPDTLQEWMKLLKKTAGKLRNAFAEKQTTDIIQWKSSLNQQLFEYKFSSDILMQFHHQLAETIDDPASDPADLARQNCCTTEEFIRIFKQAESTRQELLDLRKRMVEGNLRLVIKIVNQYSYRQLSVSDLVQEGNIGLMRSLEKFDFNLKHKFSTYASWWIRQSIGRAIAEQFRVIRIPAHMISAIAAINRTEQRFILEHDRAPEIEEIAALLEMPAARVSAIRKMARQTISLQSPLSTDENGSSLADIIPDEQAQDPARNISGESVQLQLKKLLGALSHREQQILKMRFGLLGERVHTLQEISEYFNISRERVRQLEMQTLSKLRTPETLRLFGSHDI